MDNRYYSNNNGILKIGDVSCLDIVSKFGTPIYVYNQNKIEDIISAFKKSLVDNYDGFGKIYYASKAFCSKEMCRVVNSLNIGIDVVSGGEIYTAKSVDFPMQNVIFHGNNKSNNEIEMAVDNNVKYLVIDSFFEAKKINDYCKKNNKIQSILIRVNPGIEAHTHKFIQTAKIDSKFGFSIDSGEAFEVVKNVLSLSNIKLEGLHCHIGSQIFEIESYLETADKMLLFYKTIKENLNYEFNLLDLGGGFGIWYNEDDKIFNEKTYYDFIKQILNKVKEKYIEYKLVKPFVIFEPGRSIVGEAGCTLYTIGSVKQIKDVKTYLNIDGGMFDNPRFALYNAKYTVIAPTKLNDNLINKYSIAGKCCESGDKIREDCYLPKMEEGDLLCVLSTGAYNYSMASNYNRNAIPPVIFIKDGNVKLVVRRQTYDDIIKNDL